MNDDENGDHNDVFHLTSRGTKTDVPLHHILSRFFSVHFVQKIIYRQIGRNYGEKHLTIVFQRFSSTKDSGMIKKTCVVLIWPVLVKNLKPRILCLGFVTFKTFVL